MTSEPKLTKDLSKARNNLDEFGYCLIAEALTTKELETALTRLEEQAAEEERRGLSFRDGGPEQKLVDDFGVTMHIAWARHMLDNREFVIGGGAPPRCCCPPPPPP